MGALEEVLGSLMGGEGGLAELMALLNRLDEGIRWLAHAVDENTDYMKRRDAYPTPPKVD